MLPAYVQQGYAGSASGSVQCVLWNGKEVITRSLCLGSVIQAPAHNNLGMGFLVGSTDSGQWLQLHVPAHDQQKADGGVRKVKTAVYSVQGAYSRLVKEHEDVSRNAEGLEPAAKDSESDELTHVSDVESGSEGDEGEEEDDEEDDSDVEEGDDDEDCVDDSDDEDEDEDVETCSSSDTDATEPAAKTKRSRGKKDAGQTKRRRGPTASGARKPKHRRGKKDAGQTKGPRGKKEAGWFRVLSLVEFCFMLL